MILPLLEALRIHAHRKILRSVVSCPCRRTPLGEDSDYLWQPLDCKRDQNFSTSLARSYALGPGSSSLRTLGSYWVCWDRSVPSNSSRSRSRAQSSFSDASRVATLPRVVDADGGGEHRPFRFHCASSVPCLHVKSNAFTVPAAGRWQLVPATTDGIYLPIS